MLFRNNPPLRHVQLRQARTRSLVMDTEIGHFGTSEMRLNLLKKRGRLLEGCGWVGVECIYS